MINPRAGRIIATAQEVAVRGGKTIKEIGFRHEEMIDVQDVGVEMRVRTIMAATDVTETLG